MALRSLFFYLYALQLALESSYSMRRKCGTSADPKQEYEFRNEHAPIPLRSKRPRALTAPLPEPSALQRLSTYLTKQQQVTHDQLQSALFTLPFEIREKIWKYVLTENRVVLVHLSKRLGHFRCTWDGTGDHGCCQGNEWRAGRMKPMSFAPRPLHRSLQRVLAQCESTKSGLLSLSKTCRRIYSETIDMLYRDNTFQIHHLWALTDLKATTLSQRFNLIRRLNINWHTEIPYNMSDYHNKYPTVFGAIVWKEFWDGIAHMPGLKVLLVYIAGVWINSMTNLQELLEPMQAVKQCDEFVVVVNPDVARLGLLGDISGPFKFRLVAQDDHLEDLRPF